jgi:hypothetical protein
LFFIISGFHAAAQEEPNDGVFIETSEKPQETATIPPKAADETNTVFYIRDIKFNTTGMTRNFALLYHAQLKEGEQITGLEELEKFRRQKIQLLLNQRALEFVNIEYTIGEIQDDALVPVDLLIITKDTWNIIALPKPQYDSNNGFELTLKARDYNFLGTLSPLRIDLGYTLDMDETTNELKHPSRGSFNFEIDSDTPFKLFGYTWNFNFDHAFSYVYKEPLHYKNTTGISIELPVSSATATLGFEQGFIANEDNTKAYEDDYDPDRDGDRFVPFYMSSKSYADWEIPTPVYVGNFGKLTYYPGLSGQINYLPKGDIDYLRRGPTATFSQRFGFGQINWIENFRSGIELYLGNGNTYNFHRNEWDISLFFSTTAHFPITSFFGISGRLRYQRWLLKYNTAAGDVIRGVLDKDLDADYILSFNSDFPVQIFSFLPSKWSNNAKLRFFDFDFHISPFFDVALLNDPNHNTSFSDIPVLGAGMEFIIFPHFMRSLYVRVSLGYNINHLIETKSPYKLYGDEFFIGIGHHY